MSNFNVFAKLRPLSHIDRQVSKICKLSGQQRIRFLSRHTPEVLNHEVHLRYFGEHLNLVIGKVLRFLQPDRRAVLLMAVNIRFQLSYFPLDALVLIHLPF